MRRALLAPVTLLAAAVVTLGLAACGPDNSAAGTGAAGANGAAGAGVDSCLAGAWHVNLAELAQQVATKTGHNATGTTQGTLTVTFGSTLAIDYAYTMIITSPSSNGLAVTLKDTYNGTATSSDYKATGGKITGTMAANTVKKQTTMVVAGVEKALPAEQLAGSLDLSNGLTSYTCSGSTAAINNGTFAWNLTKA